MGLSTRFVLDLEMGAGSGTGSSPGGGPRASAVGIRRWSDALGRRRIRRGCRRARARGPGRHTSAYTGDVDLVKSAGGHAVMITAPGDQVAMVAGGDGMLHRQYGSSVSSARQETADGTSFLRLARYVYPERERSLAVRGCNTRAGGVPATPKIRKLRIKSVATWAFARLARIRHEPTMWLDLLINVCRRRVGRGRFECAAD